MNRRPFALAALPLFIVALAPLSARAANGWSGGALPVPAGTNLPRNLDAEPGIAVDGAGTYWIASDISPNAPDPRDSKPVGLLTGGDIWKSTDGGQSYQWVANPFSAQGGNNPGLAGEDTDIAAASAPNSNGFYNVYAVSLWVGSTSVAVSQDGGKTWSTNPLGGVPAQDRPWVAADGACTYYVSYHQLPTWDPVINKFDACNQTNVGMGSALNPTQTYTFGSNSAPGLTNVFNKLVVDNSATSPHQHAIYQPFEGCAAQSAQDIADNAQSQSGCATGTEISLGVSTDGGQTFTDHHVAQASNGEEPVWSGTVATDAAGTVYYAWSDNHNSFLNVSNDGGQTWSAPVQLNDSRSAAAVYPTVAAGAPGQVEIAWYGSPTAGDSNDTKAMGLPGKPGAADWYVFIDQSTDSGKTLTETQVTDLIHTGILCTQGGNCTVTNGDRDLYDDFGIAISPTTGLASIAYSDDQPGNTTQNTFTAFATEAGTPGTNLPEMPLLPALVSVVAVLGGGVVWRRRRATTTGA